MHATQSCRLFERPQEVAQRIVLVAAVRVRIFGPGCRDGQHQSLACELVATRPVSEAVFENEVLPFLENRRRRIPEQRELQHDDVVIEQSLLFSLDVDVEARIVLVKIHVCNAVDLSGRLAHVAIDVRVLMPRMGVVDDELCQELSL